MSEQLIHPGFIPDYKKAEIVRQTRTFDQFRPFIRTDGLDEQSTTAFLSFLSRLFNASHDNWEPAACRSVLSLEQTSRGILSGDKFPEYTLEPKRYRRNHFWLNLQFGESTLIIDPYGVPTEKSYEGLYDLRHILPFFGRIDLAEGFAKDVYTKGESLDDWGTRDLPPGFHP